jgi:hypothetical protein
MFERLTQPAAYVLTQADIERRENRDKGLVTTIFAPFLTDEEAVMTRASFEQFSDGVDARLTRELGDRKVFHVSGKRQR